MIPKEESLKHEARIASVTRKGIGFSGKPAKRWRTNTDSVPRVKFFDIER